MAKDIVKVLMEDGFTTEQEAKELICEAQDEIHAGINPRLVMHNTLCLTVEYLEDVMSWRENTVGSTFKVLMEWLMEQEKISVCNKSNFPDYIHYVLTRLHLQNHPKVKWNMNGDEYHVLRTLIYSMHRANIFCNIMKVLCNSPELEDRMLAIILRSASHGFYEIGEKIVSYLSDEQKVTLSTRFIMAVRNAE